MQVMINLGNTGKPKGLKSVEIAIWDAIFGIASGTDPETELGILADKWFVLFNDPELNIQGMECTSWFGSVIRTSSSSSVSTNVNSAIQGMRATLTPMRTEPPRAPVAVLSLQTTLSRSLSQVRNIQFKSLQHLFGS